MQQQQPGTVSYTLTYQFLTDLQTFDYIYTKIRCQTRYYKTDNTRQIIQDRYYKTETIQDRDYKTTHTQVSLSFHCQASSLHMLNISIVGEVFM